jgi:hypothetical protein
MENSRDQNSQSVQSRKSALAIPLPLEEIEEIPELLPKEEKIEGYMTSKAKKTPQSCTSMFRKSDRKRFDSSDYFLEKELSDYCDSKAPGKGFDAPQTLKTSNECTTPNSLSTASFSVTEN